MYLRLRKRKRPLAGDNASVVNDPVPEADARDPDATASSEWIPAEPAGEGAAPPDVSRPTRPNRGKAHESARGSHR